MALTPNDIHRDLSRINTECSKLTPECAYTAYNHIIASAETDLNAFTSEIQTTASSVRHNKAGLEACTDKTMARDVLIRINMARMDNDPRNRMEERARNLRTNWGQQWAIRLLSYEPIMRKIGGVALKGVSPKTALVFINQEILRRLKKKESEPSAPGRRNDHPNIQHDDAQKAKVSSGT